MATVNLRPGDTLKLIWTDENVTPFGVQQVETVFPFTYEELLARLETRKPGTSKRSSSEGAKFSRMVGLSVNAIRKGQWSSGAAIDRNVVLEKLWKRFQELDDKEYTNITRNANRLLRDLNRDHPELTGENQERLGQMVGCLDPL